ncbi:MAG: FkbM family methyltransferase, partial [Acidimicrobiales bacterium]
DRFCRRDAGARWIRAAAGATPGQQVLTVWGDLVGSSLLPAPSPGLRRDGWQREVPVVTLDALVAGGEMAIPELVKLDIQGYELAALQGATSLMGHTEAFIVETSLYPFLPGQALAGEIIAFMAGHGYAVYDLPGFARRPSDGALAQVDICFARACGELRRSPAW